MTGSNLIALAPWIIFGAALAAITLRIKGAGRQNKGCSARGPGSRRLQ